MTVYCKDCGSQDIEVKYFVNINTKEIGQVAGYGKDHYYCNDCLGYVDIVGIDPSERTNNVKGNDTDLTKAMVSERVTVTYDDFTYYLNREPTSEDELYWFLEYLCDYLSSGRAGDDGRDWEEYLQSYCEHTVACEDDSEDDDEPVGLMLVNLNGGV